MNSENLTHGLVRPPALKRGDCIALAAPARWMEQAAVQPFIRWLEEEGFKVRCSWGLDCRHHQFSGCDDERAEALQELLDDPEVRAVVCLRGGYGTVRIIDRLDWSTYIHRPKWVVGYSDITVLHTQLHQLGFRSLHAAMPVQFPEAAPVPAHWREWLGLLTAPDRGEAYEWAHFPWSDRCSIARGGSFDGILVGGNLSVLYSLLGSRSFPDLKGKILFLEDVDEYLYHIDRMMTALRRAGVLENLGGLLIGDFTAMKDHTIPFGSTWEEITLASVSSFDYPVLFGIPAGHGEENWPLEMGIRLRWAGGGDLRK
ncbi:MAG: LD-carboxypeptidase [Sphingomonadales bacterium]|nr:LD-carboxypeptidase [Sphingomonadales bacterium]